MKPSALSICRERPDQPEVMALLAALDDYLGTLYPPEANYLLDVQALLAPEVRFHVARHEGRVVGTGAYRLQPAEPGTAGLPYGEIKRMYVDPAVRGQRIGERMLSLMEHSLREDGVMQALLETGAEQVAAVRLYERSGYVRRGPFGGYPDNGLSVFYGKAL